MFKSGGNCNPTNVNVIPASVRNPSQKLVDTKAITFIILRGEAPKAEYKRIRTELPAKFASPIELLREKAEKEVKIVFGMDTFISA